MPLGKRLRGLFPSFLPEKGGTFFLGRGVYSNPLGLGEKRMPFYPKRGGPAPLEKGGRGVAPSPSPRKGNIGGEVPYHCAAREKKKKEKSSFSFQKKREKGSKKSCRRRGGKEGEGGEKYSSESRRKGRYRNRKSCPIMISGGKGKKRKGFLREVGERRGKKGNGQLLRPKERKESYPPSSRERKKRRGQV